MEALNFSMANDGVDIVEMNATQVNKDWKDTKKEEKTQQTLSLNRTGAKKREALVNFNRTLATGGK